VRKNTCVHYRSPLHFDSCAKGINYRGISNGPREGYLARLPCVTTKLTKNQQSCCLYLEPTKDQIDAFNKKIKQIINRGLRE